MISSKENRLILHFIRVVIAVLTVWAMSLDGFNAQDTLISIGLIIWLWMPSFAHLLAHLIEWFKAKVEQR